MISRVLLNEKKRKVFEIIFVAYMKNKKYHFVGTVPKSDRKIVERGKIEIPKIYGRSLSWQNTDTAIKRDCVKLMLWV